jgi:hypothetical protein
MGAPGVVSVLAHRTMRFLIVVAVLLVGWQVFIAVSAPRRIDAAIASALERAEHLDVAVTLGFAPEDFHIRVFQAHGIVSGVRGTTVFLNRVTPDNIRRVSRYYWVQRIHPQRSPS